MKRQRFIKVAVVGVAFAGLASVPVSAEDKGAYEVIEILTASSPSHSRDAEWTPADGITLEVSGMDWYDEDTLAVSIRKGEVWLIRDLLSDDGAEPEFQLFAAGLHEPLGLLKDGDDLLVSQRAEITRLQDRDGDGIADAYLTECDGWTVTGNYHAYTYGPARDRAGDVWVTLNLGMGPLADNQTGWHGWGGVIGDDGRFLPKAFGMRSPSGIGANREGDLFFTDQQGTWIPATPVYHLRPGVFYGNQESLATQELPDAPFRLSAVPVSDVLYPEALESSPEFVPPAVWLPYNKMGRSGTDVQVIDAGGKFGPFDGQLLIGEFTNAAVSRVFLEKVGGEYQGACFPFLDGFPAAVVRLSFARDGSLFVGMTNRGWSSLGNRSYGLMQVKYTGTDPFSIQEMRARSDGFELRFTRPVDPETLENAFEMSSYTYRYSSAYGGDEIDEKKHVIAVAKVSDDGRSVRLGVEGIRQYYIHELRVSGLQSKDGAPLDFPAAYYTLNRIPEE